MPKLIVNPTSTARREIKLARTLLSIGRDPSNDLVLPDAMVSRRHAVIECRGNQYYLRDCNSSNGSVVNGDKISERSLRDGDLVAIGTARLLYREELELEDPGAKVVQHPSAPRLHCPNCKADYRKSDLFCRECGAPVQPPAGPRKAVCASCGTAVILPAKFCNACGARLPLEDGSGPSPNLDPPSAAAPPAPATTEAAEDAPAGAEASPPEPLASAEPLVAEPLVAEPLVAERGQRPPKLRSEPQRTNPFPALAPKAPEPEARADSKEPAPRVASPAPPPAPAPWRPAMVGRQEAGAALPKAPAAPGPRILAALVDGIAVTLLQAAVVGPLAFWGIARQPPGETPTGALPIVLSLGLAAVALGLAAAYHVVFWALRGATPGKRLLGLVVTAEDGSRLGWGRALARGVGYALSAASFGVGFLMIFMGGLGLHDRIAGTRVIQRRPGE